MTSIVFVCTANVSRSPYAEIRWRQMFGEAAEATSAGIPGTEGREMDQAMEAELPYEDDDALRHRSRRITADILAEHDLVLTMEFAHHMRIVEQWPAASPKVFGLRQFVDAQRGIAPRGSARDRIPQVASAVAANSMMGDIADPYRRGSRAARTCARQLDGLVLALGRGLGFEPIAEH